MITYPATIGGFKTRVIEAGQGEQVILLVHGLGARADRWRLNIDELSYAGYRVIAFDLPGHGFAEKGPGDHYNVPAFAEMVRAAIEWIGIPKVHLVGTSLGGHTVGYFATKNPERVSSLTLVCSVGLTPVGSERRMRVSQRIGDASREGVTSKFKFLVYDQSLVTEEWISEEVLINSSPGASEALSALGAYFGEHLDNDVVGTELGSLCAAGRFRTMVLWGAQEVAYPLTMGIEAAAVITGSSLVAIEGTAHAPYFERPEAFNSVLIDFLKNHLGEINRDGVAYFSN